MDNSTSLNNPVNKISSLLTETSNAQIEEQLPDLDPAVIDSITPEEIPKGESQAPPKTVEETPPVDLTEDPPEEVQDTAYINDLADELDFGIDYLYGMHLKMPRGLESQSLGELKNFYSENHDIVAQREQIAEQQADIQKQSEELQSIPKTTNQLIRAKAETQAVELNFKQVNWEELRATNAGEYAALQADFQIKWNNAKAAESEAERGVDSHLKQLKVMEQRKLFDAMPELKDETVRSEAAVVLNTFVAKYGISATEIGNLADSRYMRMMLDVSKIAQAAESVKTKKVEQVSKLQKPTRNKSEPLSKAKLKKSIERAKATGKRSDQVAAVSELLGGFVR
jgi:hypothetical protein